MLSSERVLCLHEFQKQPIVIHSDYLLFLKQHFLINDNFIISHIIEFIHSPFLNPVVSNYLKRRKVVKNEIAKLSLNSHNASLQANNIINLKCKSNFLKLCCNAMYGYSMLKSDNYTTSIVLNNLGIKALKKKGRMKISTASILFKDDKKMHFYVDTIPAVPGYSCAHIGSCILFVSKTIFLKNVHFIFSHADFKKVEFLYMDTDSLHILVNSSKLEDNMLLNLKNDFLTNAHNYLGGYKNSPICGVLELEGDFPSITYRSEKVYQKHKDPADQNFETVCKGLPRIVKKRYLEDHSIDNLFSDPDSLPYLSYWKSIQSDTNFNMYISIQTKEMANGLIPMKRHFFPSGHSTVLQ